MTLLIAYLLMGLSPAGTFGTWSYIGVFVLWIFHLGAHGSDRR